MADIWCLLECVTDSVRYSRQPPILHGSLSDYITHIRNYFITESIIPQERLPVPFRSVYLSGMIAGYKRIDDSLLPLRLKVAVPLTFSLLCPLLDMVRQSYSTPSLRPLMLAICAGFALGYALSSRPREYLRLSRVIELRYKMNSSLSYFWWDDLYYSVCRPDLFPSGYPSYFSTFLEYQKADQEGNGGPKAIAFCRTVDLRYNCLAILFDFLSLYPPAPQSPLLTGLGEQLSIDVMRPELSKLAVRFGFNPAKMKMHSSVRAGALAALELESDDVKRRQGHWSSVTGMLTYTHASLQHADFVVEKLHDRSLVPISVTQLTHNTLSISADR